MHSKLERGFYIQGGHPLGVAAAPAHKLYVVQLIVFVNFKIYLAGTCAVGAVSKHVILLLRPKLHQSHKFSYITEYTSAAFSSHFL